MSDRRPARFPMVHLIEHANPDALARAIAREAGQAIESALAVRPRATLALAGGRTPLPAYRLLAAQPLDWSRVTVVATDERWVHAGEALRNDARLATAFAAAPGLDLRRLVPDRAPEPPSAAVANAALSDLRGPFDYVLLGMGEDAHTASIFPAGAGVAPAMDLAATDDAFVVRPEPLPREAPCARVTLGLRRLLDARRHALAITGANKRAVLESACASGSSRSSLSAPIGLICAGAAPLYVHWSP